jgi:hypothetical protein
MIEPEFGRVGQDIPSDAPPMLDNGTSTARAGRSNKSAATAGLFLHLVFIGLIGAATHTQRKHHNTLGRKDAMRCATSC